MSYNYSISVTALASGDSGWRLFTVLASDVSRLEDVARLAELCGVHEPPQSGLLIPGTWYRSLGCASSTGQVLSGIEE